LKLPGLREQRELHGLSQSELARAAGVSRDSISNYETGQREAWPSTAKKLADALDVDIADIASPKVQAPSSPDEWAREHGARLHGMSNEEWNAYVDDLESVDEIGQAFRTLFDERTMLHAAWHADKWIRPENRAQRTELGRGIRDLRIRRMADLEYAATVRRAESLINEIHEAMLQEARS
jgi:transcriptional regulator with XRE-family HTH domain